jgi:hypothetical protein
MNYLFWFYVFLSFVITTGGTFYFFNQGKQILAGMYFIGLLAILIYFGVQWFTLSGSTTATVGPWPPVINYCPDLMTLYTVGTEKVCLDTIGIAQTGGISKWSDPTQTDERYLFHLFLNTNSTDRVTKLCAQAKDKKVTWEGVWDGLVCMGNEPPLPPS